MVDDFDPDKTIELVRIDEIEEEKEECTPARTPARKKGKKKKKKKKKNPGVESDTDFGEPTPVRLVNRKELGTTGIILSTFDRKFPEEFVHKE